MRLIGSFARPLIIDFSGAKESIQIEIQRINYNKRLARGYDLMAEFSEIFFE